MMPLMEHSPRSDNFLPTLSVPEVARLFRVTPATAYAWVRQGELPARRFGGRIHIPVGPLARLLGIAPEVLTGTLPKTPLKNVEADEQ